MRSVKVAAQLAVLLKLAGAQSLNVMVCSSASPQTTIQARDASALVGDLVLTCTGGPINTTTAAPIPTVDFTVTMPQPITSRVISTSGGNVSEALLRIDDSGSVAPGTILVAGFGSLAPPTLCAYNASSTSGCPAYPNVSPAGGIPVMTGAPNPLGSPSPAPPAANIYQGVDTASRLAQRTQVSHHQPACECRRKHEPCDQLVIGAGPRSLGHDLQSDTNPIGDHHSISKTDPFGGLLSSGAGPVKQPLQVNFDYRPNAAPSRSLTVPPECATLPACPQVQPVYAGLTPGFAGLYQVNFIVPAPPPGTPRCNAPTFDPANPPSIASNLTVSIIAPNSFDGAAICVDPSGT